MASVQYRLGTHRGVRYLIKKSPRGIRYLVEFKGQAYRGGGGSIDSARNAAKARIDSLKNRAAR